MAHAAASTDPGLLAQLQSLAELGVRSVSTRLQLAQAELALEKSRVLSQMARLIAGVMLGLFGLFLAVMALVWVLPPEARPWLLGGASLVFLLASGWLVSHLTPTGAGEHGLLTQTLQVLLADADTLAQRARSAGEAAP